MARPHPPRRTPPKPRPDDPDNDDEDAQPSTVSELTVHATRPAPQPGAVVGDIRPEIQLSPADVQSYGVSTVSELLNELAPETRSGRGRGSSAPVVLLNGHRISGFNEIQNIPTEAILRVDILPEEVSLKYGYSADQRVVNIVLKRRFRAITGEAGAGTTGEGGDNTVQAEADQFQVRRDNRLNFDLKYQSASGLTYADRGLDASAGGAAPFAFGGNVVSATPGGEIDPGLSALAGGPVTVAGVPALAASGQPLTLPEFAPSAGHANVTDVGADRSLAAATQSLTANAVYARPIFGGINATLNATLTGTTSRSLQGLAGVALDVPAGDPFSPFAGPVVVDRYVAGAGPLAQSTDGWTAHLGTTLNRDKGDWRLSLTGAYDHGDSVTESGRGLDASGLQAMLNQGSASFDPFAPLPLAQLAGLRQGRAESVSDSANIQLLAQGPLLHLPAGDLFVSAKLGDSEAFEHSTSQRGGGPPTSLSLSRNDASAQLNLDLPLASKEHHVLGALGELGANVNLAVNHVSDFGVLPTLGFGLSWTPVPGYNLIVSETHDHAAPSIAQLDGAVIVTPDTPVFDYLTGQTVNVTQVSGGNPRLQADDRQVFKIGLTLRPWEKQNVSFTANYVQSHIADPIETFPAATAAIEAAFRDRFLRNADGDLTQEDVSPVNYASQDREELRWGVNLSIPVGKQPPPPSFDRRAFTRRRDGQTPRRPGGSGGGQGGQPGSDAGGGPPAAASPDGGPPSGAGPGGVPPGADDAGAPPGSGREPGGGFSGFGGGGRGGGGRGGGGRGGGGLAGFNGPPVGGRLQVAFYHTIIFEDRYLVRPGGPVLDLLNGAPAGGAGGQYQQELEGQLGYTNGGYGLRFSAEWHSGTTVAGGAAGGAGALEFSDIATVNLRVWDDFSQQRALVARYPILRGVRLTLSANNLFDQSIRVRDTAGPTPLIYQSAFLDPTGRVISLSLRKLFY